MEKLTNAFCKIIALLLVMVFSPVYAETDLEQDARHAEETYELAVALFQTDHAGAAAAFEGIDGHKDSKKYVLYYEAEQLLAAGDPAKAITRLQQLKSSSIGDVESLYYYAYGLYAEQNGKYRKAMEFYDIANILDSRDRFLVIQDAYPEIDLSKEELPENAHEGGYAYINVDVVTPIPDLGEPPDIHAETLYRDDIVQIVEFVWDQDRKLWIEVVLPSEDEFQTEIESLGLIKAADLEFMSLADEVNYRSYLIKQSSSSKQLYMRVNKNNIYLQSVAGESVKTGKQLTKQDIVARLDRSTTPDGKIWIKVRLEDGTIGYIPKDDMEALTEEETAVYRNEKGISDQPRVQITPEPTKAPDKVTTPIEIPDRPTLPSPEPIPTSKEDRYYHALWLISVGYAKYDNPINALKEAIHIFKDLGNYKNAVKYAEYSELLLLIEENNFNEALDMLEKMYSRGRFDDYKVTDLPHPNDLYIYILARKEIYEHTDMAYAQALISMIDIRDSDELAVKLNEILPVLSYEDALSGTVPGDQYEKPQKYKLPRYIPTETPVITKEPIPTEGPIEYDNVTDDWSDVDDYQYDQPDFYIDPNGNGPAFIAMPEGTTYDDQTPVLRPPLLPDPTPTPDSYLPQGVTTPQSSPDNTSAEYHYTLRFLPSWPVTTVEPPSDISGSTDNGGTDAVFDDLLSKLEYNMEIYVQNEGNTP
ncbi:hypothetical protein AGMMS49992_27680 [Clostridia bacterium]|nr:hypothetical protein AGMMS49992_27680 [Clostridia bacterium]